MFKIMIWKPKGAGYLSNESEFKYESGMCILLLYTKQVSVSSTVDANNTSTIQSHPNRLLISLHPETHSFLLTERNLLFWAPFTLIFHHWGGDASAIQSSAWGVWERRIFNPTNALANPTNSRISGNSLPDKVRFAEPLWSSGKRGEVASLGDISPKAVITLHFGKCLDGQRLMRARHFLHSLHPASA